MYPVAWLSEARGIGMLDAIHIVAFGFGGKRVGAEAVIEMRDHLALIERQATFLTLIKDVAAQFPSIADQLCVGTEEMGIVCHVEHSAKGYVPGIDFYWFFLNQNGQALIDGSGEFAVAARAEDGTGARVGIDQAQVFGGQRETTGL